MFPVSARLGARFARTHRCAQVEQDTKSIVASGAAPALFPLAGKGRARLIGTIRDERANHPNTLKFEAPLDLPLHVFDNRRQSRRVATFPTVCASA